MGRTALCNQLYHAAVDGLLRVAASRGTRNSTAIHRVEGLDSGRSVVVNFPPTNGMSP